MQYFDHEKLDVYKVAIEWVILSEKIAQQLPRGRAYLVDQLQRAGTSIPFNIAEGAGEYSCPKRIDFTVLLNVLRQNVQVYWMCVTS